MSKTVSRLRTTSRWILGGPLTLIGAIVLMAGSSIWLPGGPSGLESLVWAVVLLPAYFAILFLYVVIEQSVLRAWIVILAVIGINGAFVAQSFLG